MELYYVIAITDRDDAETLNGIYKQTGIPLVLTKLGMGTAKSEHLSIYGLDATQKAVVSPSPLQIRRGRCLSSPSAS